MMPKYAINRYYEMRETWYVKAESEEDAFNAIQGHEPHEMEPLDSSDYEIVVDESLDEAEENTLKEQSWRNGSIIWRKDVR